MTLDENDKRIELILEHIIKFTQNDFQARLTLSEKGDALDAVMAVLNSLGEELDFKQAEIKKDKKRISSLMELLLRYTTMDFSQLADISDHGDEIDAIAVGLNTLKEELEFNLKKVKESEEKFRKVFELNPAGTGLFNLTTNKIIDINESYLEIIGYTREEILNGILKEQDFLEYLRLQEVSDGQIPFVKNKEVSILKKTGEKKTVLFSVEQFTVNNERLLLSIVYDISERKLIEDQLREREEQIKTIFNAAPDAVIVIDDESNIIQWNPTARLIFGWNELEAIDKRLGDLIISPGNKKKHSAGLEYFLNHKDVNYFNGSTEIQVINKQNKELTVSVGVSPTSVNGKNVFICFIRDITELKRAEKKVKESEERLLLMVENVKDYAIILLDPNGYILSWNKGAERIKGYSAEEIIGKHFSVFYTQEEKQRKEPEFNLKMAKESGRYETEAWRVRKDNSQFFADIIYTALYDEKKKFKGYAKITRDITDRREAEEKVKRTAVQLAASQKMAHIGSWEWDLINNAISWSDELYLIYGLMAQQFQVQFGAAEKFTHPSDRNLVDKIANSAYYNKSAFVLDYRIIRTDGAIRTINERAEVVKNNDGIPIKMFGTVHDITEQKKTEKEIIRKSEELARSNAELEQFAYVASHDLQEPLRMITSYVQLLEKKYKNKLDQDGNDFINFAVDGASRMQNLIYSLLEYSRVNRIKPLEFIEIDKILHDIKKDLSMAIKESNAKIIWNKLPVIFGDKVLIGQLFLNLIANAIKFRGEKPLEIIIDGKKVNNEFLFSVTDNGIGIKKEYAEKIFIIFQRLHAKEKYPGTGIGLAICKKIVERHEGKIWVESEENTGSKFYFTIKADLKSVKSEEVTVSANGKAIS